MECFFSKLIFHINKAFLCVILFQFYDSTRYYHPYFIITETEAHDIMTFLLWTLVHSSRLLYNSSDKLETLSECGLINAEASGTTRSIEVNTDTFKNLFYTGGSRVGGRSKKEVGMWRNEQLSLPTSVNDHCREGQRWLELRFGRQRGPLHPTRRKQYSQKQCTFWHRGCFQTVELQAQEQRDTWWGG